MAFCKGFQVELRQDMDHLPLALTKHTQINKTYSNQQNLLKSTEPTQINKTYSN